jgi:hypothetical protein
MGGMMVILALMIRWVIASGCWGLAPIADQVFSVLTLVADL